MKNMTLVTDPSGNLIAAVHGHELKMTKDGVTAEVSFAQSHKLHKVQVEDSLTEITDPEAFHQAVSKHLPN